MRFMSPNFQNEPPNQLWAISTSSMKAKKVVFGENMVKLSLIKISKGIYSFVVHAETTNGRASVEVEVVNKSVEEFIFMQR